MSTMVAPSGTLEVARAALAQIHDAVGVLQGLDLAGVGQDDELLGLPISAATPIRVNKWRTDGPPAIVEVRLSRDAVYQGIPLSNFEPVDFYDADNQGVAKLESFAPQGDLIVPAAGQKVVVAPLKLVHLNRDGSLRYGFLATDQMIQGILFPENAIIFFGDTANDPVSSVGLAPGTAVRIDGVTYDSSIDQRTLFLDFDAHGKVVRVRQ